MQSYKYIMYILLFYSFSRVKYLGDKGIIRKANWFDATQKNKIINKNLELPDVQARFRKGRGTIDKAREFQKNI